MSNTQAMRVTTESKPVAPIMGFKNDLERMKGDIAAMLPSQIPVDRFIRTAITAVSMEPDLLKADKKSLIMACMNAAKDGLLPDKKEAAFVIFNTKEKDVWVKKVQYMPMVQGLIKKLRQSGELASLSVQVVNEKDKFSVIKGDDERIEHIPHLDGDAGEIKFAYAIAKLKDGTIQREVMTKTEIEKIRSVSKAGSGESAPWVKWYSEMARKSVLRRLMKFLPSSTEIEETIKSDNETYDFDGSFVDVSEGIPEQPRISANPLDAFAGGKAESNKKPDEDNIPHEEDQETVANNQSASTSELPPEQPAFNVGLYDLNTQTGNRKAAEDLLKILAKIEPDSRASYFLQSDGREVVNALGRNGLGMTKKKFIELGIVLAAADAA